MANDLGAAGRVQGFLDGVIGPILGNCRRRASFAMYAQGLLSDAERKSMEPIAARACGSPRTADAYHQRLQWMISEASWDDAAVRLGAARYAVAAMGRHSPISSWIIDDTGMLKQGKHSVGVQRQYTGSAGKIANCQIAVTLTVANHRDQFAVDTALYLPASWTNDPERRERAHIPAAIEFQTKPELAITMIHRALRDGIAPGVVLADSAYGSSSEFRISLRELGLQYAVGVNPETKAWQLDSLLRRRGHPLTVEDMAAGLRFRRLTWREGTKGKMSSRFAFTRVVPFHDDGIDPSTREDVWLIAEWLAGEESPTKYNLCSLPSATTKVKLVRVLKDRWRTERVYQDLKGELGFDHFEGRTFAGWHHHVSIVHCCAALLVAERARRFPPSARRAETIPSQVSSQFAAPCPQSLTA